MTAWILTEGASGSPDGYCAFYVSAGTHKFELRKGGYSTSKSWYCQCGTDYSWVSMPDYWCGDAYEHPPPDIFAPQVAKPVLTYPLKITPEKDKYYVGDTIRAEFTINNIGGAPITLDKLLVGGRFNDGKLPNGQFPDFTPQSTTLPPNGRYTGTLTLTQPGNYHFFVAYYIENPTPEEKKLLDGNNWNTCVDLGDGLTDEDRIEDIKVLSLLEGPYIDNEFWIAVSNPAGAYICNDSVAFTFGRNLKLGDRGNDVKYLQIVLNANPATQVAVEGPGSPCHETKYFGPLTEAAVIKFQTLHEWLTQTGKIDAATRAELNKLYLPVKHVPNEWVLNVTNTAQNEEIQDGCLWWEVEDVTDGIKGWVAYQKISDETKYLEIGDPEELKNRVKKLNTRYDRIPVIRQEVTEHRIEFLDNFPLGLILAMAIRESGGKGFDNEIVALTPWGRGIMQIDTDNYVGEGSGIRWYNNGAVDYCRGKEGHGCTCSGGICCCEACKHYYTNTTQGIEANIKDGLGALKDKYKDSNCCYNRSKNAEWDKVEGLYREEMGAGVIFYSKNEKCEKYDSKIEKIGINNIEISCDDFKVIDTVWRYNSREIYSGDPCEKSDYLRCVADDVDKIKPTFRYKMPNKDTWIESLKAVSRRASVMEKIK